MGERNSRVEFEDRFRFQDITGSLFASLGKWDDYLELQLPAAGSAVTPLGSHLAQLTGESPFGIIDVRVQSEPAALITIDILYAGFPEQQALARRERLAVLLAELVRREPALDFGTLLPTPPAAVEAREAHDTPTPAAAAAHHSPVQDGRPRPAVTSTRQIDDAASRQSSARAASIEAAMEHARRGQWHKARQLAEEVLHADPNLAAAWRLKQELETLEQRGRRRRREPRNAQAQLEWGFSCLALGCVEQAIPALDAAVQLDPRQHLTHLLVGAARHQQGQAEAAVAAYQRAAQLRPGDGLARQLAEDVVKGAPAPRLAELGDRHHEGPMGRYPAAPPPKAWASLGRQAASML